MKTVPLGKTELNVPSVGIGCMRINRVSKPEAEKYIGTALELGANYFDHADIYGNGECEEIFADVIHMSDDVREKIILQSKCGIRRGVGYDFSKKYILESVDGILKRLKTDYLDVLLLHRPDALVEPEEVAEAFNVLQESGKVCHFGVSNHNSLQIKLLDKYLSQPVQINQLQFSIAHSGMVTQGLHVNMSQEAGVDRDGGVLDYCRLNDITIQPWSPFQYGFFKGVFLDNSEYPELNAELNLIAEKYNVSNVCIAMAWILRHPAKMQPIIGTMNTQRLADCVQAGEIYLTREEWYGIYKAAGNTLP